MRQVLEEILRERQGPKIAPLKDVPLKEDNWVFRRKTGKRVVSFRGAFDLAAERAGITETDDRGERFTPHCYRRAAITRWTKLGMPDAIVRRCSGHSPRDVHENYIQFEDRELVEAFDKAGLLSPPPAQQEERAVSNAG